MIIISAELIHKKYKYEKKISKFPPPHHVKKGFFILSLKTDNGLIGYGELSSYESDFNSVVKLFKNKFSKSVKNLKVTKNIFNNHNSVIEKTSRLESTIHAAISQCLLDILSKNKSIPAFKYFGKTKKAIKAYASGGLIFSNQEYESLLDEMHLAKEKKFFGWKFRPSTPKLFLDHHKRFTQKPKIDISKLSKFCLLARKEVGDKFNLMIDLGCRLNPGKEAKYFLNLLKELNFYFVEEPFDRKYQNYREYKKINNLACGEDVTSINTLKKYSKHKQIKYLQPDINLLTVENLLHFSSKNKKKIIMHNWTKSGSFYANLNLALINNNCNLIEYNFLNFPKDYCFLKKNYLFENGYIKIKSKSGIGIEIINNNSFKTNIYKFY